MSLLAIDIGGSGSRILALGEHEHRADGPPPAVSVAGYEHGAVIRALGSRLGAVAYPVDVVAVSAAGLISRGERDELVRAIRETWQPARILLVSDAVAAVAGVWGSEGGAVVAVGTGVAGFGTDLRATWRRSDGWGLVLGDEGGAAWIGRRGLTAALRAFDGRGAGSDVLLEAARERYDDVVDLPARLRRAPSQAAELAAFAPAVTAAGRAGDSVAAAIVAEAAAHLARTGLSVLVDGVPPRLALVGGVAAEQPLADAFIGHVRGARPEVELQVSRSTPLDGALALAREVLTGTGIIEHFPYLTIHTHTAS